MIKRGREAINESLSKGQGGGQYAETTWVSWKGGETKVLRFLTDIDDILVVSMHSMVDTHDGKKANFVCRSVFDAPCELCAAGIYKRDAGYGVAVVRQPVHDVVDGVNKVVGYEDQVVEYEEETPQGIVKKKKPVVGIVNQSMRNFWNTVALVHEKYGDLRGFDMEIVRQGSGTDTVYVSFPLPPKPIENMDSRYEKFVPDLEGFLNRIGSPEYYASRLHGIVPDKKDEPPFVPVNNTPPVQAAPVNDLDEQTTADRLRSKLESNPYG
jgi:hypothetical protein